MTDKILHNTNIFNAIRYMGTVVFKISDQRNIYVLRKHLEMQYILDVRKYFI